MTERDREAAPAAAPTSVTTPAKPRPGMASQTTEAPLDGLAAPRRRSGKRIVKDAIDLHSETVEQQPDPLDLAFGAWRRSESPERLRRRMRAAFGDSTRKHRE